MNANQISLSPLYACGLVFYSKHCVRVCGGFPHINFDALFE